MMIADMPENEAERLFRLKDLGILDTKEEAVFDNITRLAAEICETPICLVSLIDEKRQWFKAHHGLEARETPRDYAFCAHAINENEPFIVADSTKDERFHDNPLVTGEPNVVFYAGAQLRLPDGHNIGTLCVIDNKPRELSEKQIRKLGILAEQVIEILLLKGQNQYMKLMDELKEEWIRNISHDLRSPAGAVVGFSSLLESRVDSMDRESMKKIVQTMYRSSKRMIQMLNDIIELKDVAQRGLKVDLAERDLCLVVKDTVEEMAPVALEFNRSIIGSCGGEKLIVPIDEGRMKQVLDNLLTNAFKYSKRDTEIQVAVYKEQDSVCVAVRNQGIGIPQSDLKNIFSKYGQSADERSGEVGAGGARSFGLGLYLTKALVEKMNGKIGVTSEPNGVTEFLIRFEH